MYIRPLSVSAKKLRGILNKILKQHNEVVWYTVIDVNTGILCGNSDITVLVNYDYLTVITHIGTRNRLF